MTSELSSFAARVREHIGFWSEELSLGETLSDPAYREHADIEFSGLAVMLFTLQFKHNAAYRRLCEARGIKPGDVHHWSQIPPVPTVAFKELDLTSLHPEDRARVFHSSGTTEQRPSRHFHNADSLALYEASLWPWFKENCGVPMADCRFVSLTPPAEQAPHSSLVHMFDFVRHKFGADPGVFVGRVGNDGAWTVDVDAAVAACTKPNPPPHGGGNEKPLLVVGTAFSFVHLVDALVERNLRLQPPAGSRVLETGGYKGRSRILPKAELHRLIQERLGVAAENIICEYGMSELSSQAYENSLNPSSRFESKNHEAPPLPACGHPLLHSEWRRGAGRGGVPVHGEDASRHSSPVTRHFKFPPWARARVISPETKQEVAEGEAGLLQVFDLANTFSVMAIQTEDLAVRRGDGFELIGRAPASEARGCSLLSSDS